MPSFFLAETCKYLYLLYDTDNFAHSSNSNYMFTTEGHIFPIDYDMQLRFGDTSKYVFERKHKMKARPQPVKYVHHTILLIDHPSRIHLTDVLFVIPIVVNVKHYLLIPPIPIVGMHISQVKH
jgi:hypothetical protein